MNWYNKEGKDKKLYQGEWQEKSLTQMKHELSYVWRNSHTNYSNSFDKMD